MTPSPSKSKRKSVGKETEIITKPELGTSPLARRAKRDLCRRSGPPLSPFRRRAGADPFLLQMTCAAAAVPEADAWVECPAHLLPLLLIAAPADPPRSYPPCLPRPLCSQDLPCLPACVLLMRSCRPIHAPRRPVQLRKLTRAPLFTALLQFPTPRRPSFRSAIASTLTRASRLPKRTSRRPRRTARARRAARASRRRRQVSAGSPGSSRFAPSTRSTSTCAFRPPSVVRRARTRGRRAPFFCPRGAFRPSPHQS